MNFRLQLTFHDGTSREVTGTLADMVAFESKFDISVSRIGVDTKITHMLWLAWHSLKRTGDTKDDFEQWLDSVSGVEAASPKA